MPNSLIVLEIIICETLYHILRERFLFGVHFPSAKPTPLISGKSRQWSCKHVCQLKLFWAPPTPDAKMISQTIFGNLNVNWLLSFCVSVDVLFFLFGWFFPHWFGKDVWKLKTALKLYRLQTFDPIRLLMNNYNNQCGSKAPCESSCYVTLRAKIFKKLQKWCAHQFDISRVFQLFKLGLFQLSASGVKEPLKCAISTWTNFRFQLIAIHTLQQLMTPSKSLLKSRPFRAPTPKLPQNTKINPLAGSGKAN